MESEIYDVEKILKHRKHGMRYEFCVKWLGYGMKDNTWEPIDSFDNNDVFNKYLEKINYTHAEIAAGPMRGERMREHRLKKTLKKNTDPRPDDVKKEDSRLPSPSDSQVSSSVDKGHQKKRKADRNDEDVQSRGVRSRYIYLPEPLPLHVYSLQVTGLATEIFNEPLTRHLDFDSDMPLPSDLSLGTRYAGLAAVEDPLLTPPHWHENLDHGELPAMPLGIGNIGDFAATSSVCVSSQNIQALVQEPLGTMIQPSCVFDTSLDDAFQS